MIAKTISHYKIVEKLGEGGMGEVYLAEDLKLGRKVAIKFLPHHLTKDKENIERFEREAKTTASLNHPNIVTIHEIAAVDDQIFIVMEYVEGKSLRDVINEYKLDHDKIIDIISQISEGLSKAHQAGIVHRDIKPENIIIDKDARVKILDFGLAKLKGVTKLTKDSSTVGTIHYMSPEQLRGEEVDIRSDIWSLGIVFYEMLAGDVPFKGDYDQAVAYSIHNEELESISQISPEHNEMMHKLLAKEPEKRYQSLEEFTDALGGRKGSKKTKRMSRQKKYMIYPVSLLALIIVGYYLITNLEFDQSKDSSTKWKNSIGVLTLKDLSPERDQEWFCDGMAEQITSNLSKLPKLKVISRTSMMKYKDTSKSLPEIGEELNVAHILEGSILKIGNRIRVTVQLINTKDDSHVWSEEYDKAYKNLFEVQDNVSEAIARSLLQTLSGEEIEEIKMDRPKNIEIYDKYIRARDFHYKSLTSRNTEYLYNSISLLNEILKEEPDYLSANIELVDVYNTYYNNFAESDEEKKRYLELQKKYLQIAYRLNPKSLEVRWVKLLVSLAEYGEEKWYRIHIDFLKDYPNHARANWSFGQDLYRIGLVQQSLPYIEKANILNPFGLWHCLTRARAYFRIGEYKKAETDFKKALQIDPNEYWTLLRYTHYLISFKKVAEAESLMVKLQKIKPYDTDLERHRAYLYAIKGDTEKALSHFNRTISNKEKRPYFDLATLYIFLGDQETAIEFLIESEKELTSQEQEVSRYLRYVNVPCYRILNDNPRFQEILAKHKELYEENLRKYGDIDI